LILIDKKGFMMVITTVNELETGLESRFSRPTSIKTDPTGGAATAGHFVSFWRASGIPAPGTIPTTTPATANTSTTGAIPFMQQSYPVYSYLSEIAVNVTVPNATVEIHDRLIQMGGLSGANTAVQPVTGFDLLSFSGIDNIDERIGDANYSDVQWWVEFYADIGGTASVATVGVTYDDGSVGQLSGISAFGRRISRMLPLNSFIPAAASGRYIRGISNIVLNASTGGAGNFGFTATRYRASMFVPLITQVHEEGWVKTGLPQIYNNSCLFPVVITPGTSAGNIAVTTKISHG
jgi:hypothetical protein